MSKKRPEPIPPVRDPQPGVGKDRGPDEERHLKKSAAGLNGPTAGEEAPDEDDPGQPSGPRDPQVRTGR